MVLKKTQTGLDSCCLALTYRAMKTITITEAKRSLGSYLKRAAAGEDIGIISGADIISLRRVEVMPVDKVASGRIRDATDSDDWPAFEAVGGGPADGARNHDRYLYPAPAKKGSRKAKK